MTAHRGVLKHSGLRVLVTGGRNYADREHVFRSLDRVHRKHGVLCIISGMANGADTLSVDWANAHRIPVAPYPVSRSEWKAYRGYAGHRRNETMIREGCPDICVAFPGHNGTHDCISRCHEHGVLVWDALTNEVSGSAASGGSLCGRGIPRPHA